MAEGKHQGALDSVYNAKRPEEIAALYDDWAERYDQEMALAGYRHPSIVLALMARYLPAPAGPILDAGAGTGMLGAWLGIIGYGPVEALDISPGMLAVAARKGGYSTFHQLALGQTLPFADGHYAGVVSSGVFTTGHVGAEGLDELVRICRPGGAIILTIKNTVWDAGFDTRLKAFEADGILARLEETEPYISMPGETDTVPGRAVALRKL